MTTTKATSNQKPEPQVLGELLEKSIRLLTEQSLAQNSFFLISLGTELPHYISIQPQKFSLFITEVGRLIIKHLPSSVTLIGGTKRIGQTQEVELSFSSESLVSVEQSPLSLELKDLYQSLLSSEFVQQLCSSLSIKTELNKAHTILLIVFPLQVAQGENLGYFNRFHHQLAHKSLLILSDQPMFTKHLVKQAKQWGLQPFYYSNSEMEQFQSLAHDFSLAIVGPVTLSNQRAVNLNRFYLEPNKAAPIQVDFSKDHRFSPKKLTYPFAREELFTALIEATTPPASEEKTEVVKIFNREQGKENPLNIMVVDDHRLNLQVMDKILLGFGYKATAHDNPFDAIENLKTEKFDLVFLDIQMPKMDGCQALVEVKSLKLAHEPIFVALTATPKDEFGQSFFELGFNDFFAKPILPKNLKDLLQKWQQIIYKQNKVESPTIQNSKPLGLPILNDEVVQSRIELGWDFFQTSVTELVSDLSTLTLRLSNALAAGQLESLAAKAHYTKGQCSNLGCYRLELALEDLSQAGAANDMGSCAKYLGQLPTIIIETTQSLNQLMQKGQNEQ